MRQLLLPTIALLACTVAAQTKPPLVQESQPLDPRKNQKVERIVIEDKGATIEEMRYGGQTQSITVKPKADVPEYEIQPTDLGRSRPGDNRNGISSSTGQRVWNVFKF
ncbi:MAG TPA: hypothetical protein VK996_13120 [Ramlibacter sp.]|nr:hypothetical protein [Ramlibacter sp.]